MTSLNLLGEYWRFSSRGFPHRSWSVKRMVKNQYPHGIGLTKTAKGIKKVYVCLCQCYCTLYTVYRICKAYTNRSVPKQFSSNYAKCQGQWHNPRNQCIEIFTGTFGLALSGGGWGGTTLANAPYCISFWVLAEFGSSNPCFTELEVSRNKVHNTYPGRKWCYSHTCKSHPLNLP